MKVQGVDYTYNLQGWLKGINSISMQPQHDPARDGQVGSANQYVAKDALGFTLYYFTDDYKPINTSGVNPSPPYGHRVDAGTYRPLYNGNIVGSTHTTRMGTALNNYNYDQLNRLVRSDLYSAFNTGTYSWNWAAADERYRERFVYDANGNITKVWRNGSLHTNSVMDSLTYHYTAGTNRLDHIRDSVPSGKYGPTLDIKNQTPGNYQYDAIGNLKSSVGYGTNNIKWNVYGKIEEVDKQQFYNSGTRFHHYYYDPSGNRVGVAHRAVTMHYFTWYVRDAQGNVMAVYKVDGVNAANQGTLNLTEHHMYGSSRLGLIRRNVDADQPRLTAESITNLGNGYLANFTRGRKLFELTNHLGNVAVVVSDRVLPTAVSGVPTTIRDFTAEVITASDFYAFGSNTRTYNAPWHSYRYGFNGKEVDNEMFGLGNELDYGMRVYDPRAGRFLSVDPLTSKFVDLSPYTYAGNSPIEFIDDGARPIPSKDLRLMFATSLQHPNFYAAIWTANNTSFRHLEKVVWYKGPRDDSWFKNGYNTIRGQMGQAIVADFFEQEVYAWHMVYQKNPIKAWNLARKTFDVELNKGLIDIQLTFKTGKLFTIGSKLSASDVSYALTFNKSDGSEYKVMLKDEATTKVNLEVKTVYYSINKHKENIERVIKEGVDQTISNMKKGAVGVLVLPKEFWDEYKNDSRAIQEIGRLNNAGGHLLLKKNQFAIKAGEMVNELIEKLRTKSSDPKDKDGN